MYAILKGIGVGFSIAAPVGAIGLLCIQQTLAGGILLGLVCGLGAATADMMYGILVALGLKAFQTVILQCKTPLTIAGGLFLCYLGIKKFLSPPATIAAKAPTQKNLGKAYIVTFFLTLTNPATILDFTALFTSLNIDVSGYFNSLIFVAGVFIGSACWWFLLCFTVGTFRKKVSTNVLQYINYGAGIIIFSFDVYAIAQLFSLHTQ